MDKENITHTHTHQNMIQPLIQKEILPFVTIWMDLEGIMLSEVSREREIPNDLP